MSELTCTGVREAAAEYALGILPPDERGPVAAHLLRCDECRAEVEEITRLGEDLLELIPAAEPPLGFDRKVLAVAAPQKSGPAPARRRWFAGGAAALVAAAAVVALVFGVVAADGRSHRVPEQSAPLVAAGRVIGTVYTEGNPRWLSMKVEGAGLSGTVTCDLVEADGAVIRLGSFDLVAGSGSWAAPEPAGTGSVIGARLVSADGRVLAVATFKA